MSVVELPIKLQGETPLISFDFISVIPSGSSIFSKNVSISVFSGVDNGGMGSMLLVDTLTDVGSVVSLQVQEGTPGVVYLLTAGVRLDSASGPVYQMLGKLAVLDSDPFVAADVLAGPLITGDAPDGIAGEVYSYAYTVFGGNPPVVVTLLSGTLPPGLSLSSAGVLSGTLTTDGAYSWTVRATDVYGLYDNLPDSADVGAGLWFFGPANQNGVFGGGTGYYLRANTPAELVTATAIAVPSPMTSIGRISVANRLIFLHHGDGSQNAQVSSDGGDTWTACNNSLYSGSFGVLDVYWNGSYYYWADKRSADGITWGAIPNFPAITVDSWFARESDGLYFVAATNGNIYTTLDDGATAFTTRTSPFSGSTFSAFESNGTRIYGSAAGGIGVGYSDDAFATAATASATGPGGYKRYAATVWLGQRVAGFMKRSTDGTAWSDSQATITYMANSHFADYGDGTFAFCDTTAANTHRIYSSADAGASWANEGLVYGPGASIAFVSLA